MQCLRLAIGALTKFGFLVGSITRPALTNPNINAWYGCNLKVSSWICVSVSPEIALVILYIDSAEKMWKLLKKRYKQSNEPKIFELQQEINNITQICSCGIFHGCACKVLQIINACKEKHLTMVFLMGLSATYLTVRGNILLMEPFPSFNEIYSLIIQEERQRAFTRNPGFNHETIAMIASQNNSAPEVVAAPVQSRNFNNTNTYGQRERPLCAYCNRKGHIRDKCFELNGYPPS